MAEGVRLAEAVAALSLAIDIGMGQPLEQGLRTCVIATGVARAYGLGDDDVARVFYLALLRHVGCTAESETAASFLCNEVAFRTGAITLDFTRPAAMLPYVFRHVAEGMGTAARVKHVGRTLVGGRQFLGMMDAVCETGQLLAERLGFDTVVQESLWQIFEHWDGGGLPGKVGGEDIHLPARFVAVAELFEGVCRVDGRDAAVGVIAERRGTAFAPDVADCLCREADGFLPLFGRESVWDDAMEAEPASTRRDLSEEQFDGALGAIADFTDLKSSYTPGHSRGVAELAGAAAAVCGLPAVDVTAVRRAGLVHDVGRVGVSATVWSKAGSLSRDEWERVRLHPYYTERVLTRPEALARLGALASTHHERLDGGGYHRAVPGSVLSRPARLLAAADGYRARIEARPHRPAMTAEVAAGSLRGEVQQGRLDAETVDAVLAAAGQGGTGRRRQKAQVGGLTDRELEVLALLAVGQSIKGIGKSLTISPKTADAHIQHIYTKLGVSTRAGATLFAVQHGVVDRSERLGDLPMAARSSGRMLSGIGNERGGKPMSADVLARKLLELIDERDWAGREALLTEDCELVTPMGVLRGRAATTGFSEPFLADFVDARHRVDLIATDGDAAVVEGVWYGTHVPTGRATELPFAATIRTDGPLVRSFHLYFDARAFVAQLSPPQAPPPVDHKATIRRMFEEVVNLGKIDLVDELFHPDYRSTTQMGAYDREGFKEFVAGWRAAFPDVRCEVGEILTEGDKVAWSIRATGTNTGDFMGRPATGRSVDFDSLNIGEFRDGLAYRHTVIMDLGRMMEQLAAA